MTLGFVLAAPALADEPTPETRWTDYSADTLDHRSIRLGLLNQEVGLLDNLQMGTSTLGWVVGFANASAKVQAIDTERLDLSLEISSFSYNLERLGVPGGKATARPMGWTLSWAVSPSWSLHLGSTTTQVELQGLVTLEQVGSSLSGTRRGPGTRTLDSSGRLGSPLWWGQSGPDPSTTGGRVSLEPKELGGIDLTNLCKPGGAGGCRLWRT